MLPVDIIKLIDNYNEHDKGFFFQNKLHNEVEYDVYWFNGKRYEKWCKTPRANWDQFVFVNGYLQTTNCIYKNLIWKKSTFTIKKKVLVLSKFYLLNGPFIEELQQLFGIPEKFAPHSGCCFEVCNDILYVFSTSYSEKYDFKTKRWSAFTNYNIYINSISHLLDGLIYFTFPHEQRIAIYNPISDSWQETSIP